MYILITSVDRNLPLRAYLSQAASPESKLKQLNVLKWLLVYFKRHLCFTVTTNRVNKLHGVDKKYDVPFGQYSRFLS